MRKLANSNQKPGIRIILSSLFSGSYFLAACVKHVYWAGEAVGKTVDYRLSYAQVVFATSAMGTSATSFGQLVRAKATALCTVFWTNNKGVKLFIHPFHSPNNMYYKERIKLL